MKEYYTIMCYYADELVTGCYDSLVFKSIEEATGYIMADDYMQSIIGEAYWYVDIIPVNLYEEVEEDDIG